MPVRASPRLEPGGTTKLCSYRGDIMEESHRGESKNVPIAGLLLVEANAASSTHRAGMKQVNESVRMILLRLISWISGIFSYDSGDPVAARSEQSALLNYITYEKNSKGRSTWESSHHISRTSAKNSSLSTVGGSVGTLRRINTSSLRSPRSTANVSGTGLPGISQER